MPPTMALKAGTKLGPYEILAPLGAGGMGEVYHAKDTRLHREVAIKVLPEHLATSPEARQRLEREARSISRLSHPHICTLYDVGHHDGHFFLVIEYLQGETLAERLNKGALPLPELLTIATQIAEALDQANRQGLIHGDLKPANIMLTRGGAKLLDFGLAKATGARAFAAESQAGLIAAILEREPPSVAAAQPSLPPSLDRLVQTCLAKGPDERRQSMHDVLVDLRWIKDAGSQAGVPAPVNRRIDANGGEPHPATDLKRQDNVTHRWPSFLPDGEHFIYTVQVTGEPPSLHLADLDGFLERTLVVNASNGLYADGLLIYARGNTLLSQPFDTAQLELTGESTILVSPVAQWGGKADFSASLGGTFVYTEQRKARGARLTLYDSEGRPTRTVSSPTALDDMAISPDGRFLALSRDEQDSELFDIWSYDITRDISTRVTFDGNGDDPTWSLDGRWIAYAHGGGQPRWHEDSRALYYLALDGMLLKVALTPGTGGRMVGDPRSLFQLSPQQPVGIRTHQYAVLPGDKGFVVIQDTPATDQRTSVVTLTTGAWD
jgi:hypothetical protein